MAKAKKEEPPKDEEEKDAAEAPAEGAEGAAEGGEAAAAEEGGFNARKIILFVVVPLVLLAAIGGGLYFTGMLDSILGKKDAATEEGAPAEAGKSAANKKGGEHGEKGTKGEVMPGASFVEIPTMIVNLNSDDGTPRYLRLTVQLELENESDKEAVQAIIPKVIDQFQTYLRELRVRDLRGSGGIYRLQMELLWRVNQAAAPVEVKDVLFQEILIQ